MSESRPKYRFTIASDDKDLLLNTISDLLEEVIDTEEYEVDWNFDQTDVTKTIKIKKRC